MVASAVFIVLLGPAAATRALADSGRKTQATRRDPFVTSHYSWEWYTNGLTIFSFSLKNQSGRAVANVQFRVLFFDSKGNQISFEEGKSSDTIPNGMTKRESITLDLDSGSSVRHLSASEKIQILGFDSATAD